ncbi:unnamed protein product [Wickerhamomyces anomalus]
MNDPNQNFHNQNQSQNVNMNPNQSLDYDQWVNSLGNIQDGIFQNTPMSNHILQNTLNNSANINNSSFGTTSQDLNLDLFFNSPERFYRDIINESPIVSKTPQIGRTPLKNLNINFSTPNFLKNIETSANHQNNSVGKNFTPLKNQLFNSKVEIFETPKLTKQNTTTLNSSPTTIKIGSSAMKNDENINPSGSGKMIPPSPTPTSKMSNNNNVVVHQPPQIAPPPPPSQIPSIPKMGCFKKATETEKQVIKKPSNNNNNRFQIIMTDVNTFANNSKSSRPKKKKLARSSTSINTSSNAVTKKNNSLKRSLSQPQAKFMKSLTPKKSIDKKPEDEPIINQPSNSNSEVSSILTSKSSESNVEDIFDDEKILSDTEKLLNNDRYF